MYKNTIKNKTGKSSGRVHRWNLFMALLLFCLSCPLSSIAEDAKPFDCTMPIILRPILLQMRKNITEEDNRDWRKQKPTRINFEISSLEIKEPDKAFFDKIVGLSYDNPVNRFAVYIKDGLPVKLEHTDESGNTHVYRQTIQDKIQTMDFENKEYLELSRQMTLKGLKSEFPFMDWKPGKYVADIRASFPEKDTSEINQENCMGEITFAESSTVYKFFFFRGKMDNACTITRTTKNHAISIIRLYDNGNLRTAKSYDKNNGQKCFETHFHKDLGLKMVFDFKKCQPQLVTLWSKQGVENTILPYSEWQTLGMPNDYDEWKKRATK